MPRDRFVGVDVGGTKILAALVDEDGRIEARRKTATPRGAKAKTVLRAAARLVEDLLGERGLRPKGLRAVGVGVPGVVDPEEGRVLAAPNVALGGVRVAKELRRALKARVVAGNDVNLGILGERWLGAARGRRDVVGLFPGTGVGGGVVAGGELLLGAHGAAAELGHLIVEPGGPLCGCGGRGCLEALASRTAIERELRRAVRAGRRSIVTELAGGGLRVIKSKVLAKALRRKDPVATQAVRRAAQALGAASVSLRHVFDPEVFVLGGGLIEACGDFIVPIVQRALDADPFFSRVGRCQAVTAQLADDAVVLGAVALARAS
ncbi:MAG: ROK family protein [Elusimicrobia bacterium]|nr:ROK family protein [Elusimicrobiota bacterium]